MSRKRNHSRSFASRNSYPHALVNGNGPSSSTRRQPARGQRSSRQDANDSDSPGEQSRWSAIPLPPPIGPLPPPPFTIQLQGPILFGFPPSPQSTDALERIPGKIPGTQSGKQQAGNQTANGQSKSYATAAKAMDKVPSAAAMEDEDPRLLLSQVDEKDSETETQSENTDIFEQSLFVRELILSLPADNDSLARNADVPSAHTAAVSARAIPVECGVVTKATNGRTAYASEKAHGISRAAEENNARASGADTLFETAAGQSISPENAVLSKGSVSDHAGATPRGADATIVAARKSNSEEKSSLNQHATDLKKESSNMRSPQYSSGASNNVAGLVRSQASRPVSSFPLLVAGATEQ